MDFSTSKESPLHRETIPVYSVDDETIRDKMVSRG
jgi:hypothetical protein